MILRLLALAVASCVFAAAAAGMPSRAAPFTKPAVFPAFRAPGLAAFDAVALPPPLAKSAPEPTKPGPRRVGSVRELDVPAHLGRWMPVPGGFVAKARASSESALGLRVRLDLGVVPGAMEIRAQGSDGRIETMVLDPTLGPQAWTPWTDGPTQVLEIFSPVLPGNDDAVRIGAVVHFDQPLEAKAAGVCTIETSCAPTDLLLPAGEAQAIQEREKSEVRLNFIDGGQAFLCSATLINTEKFPAPFLLTANHCISTDAAARTVASRWFYVSNAGCPAQPVPLSPFVQVSGGAQLVFTNYNVDSTLLLMNSPPPDGAVYSGWNPAHLVSGDPIVSVSHPLGDTARYAVGAISQQYRLEDWPQEMYGVHFSRGIIQEGSSGSGLFTMANGSLELRGILTGTTVQNGGTGLSCTDLNEDGLYSRFEIFEPEIAPYITAAGHAPDDAPNRPQDFSGAPIDPNEVLDRRATPFALDNRHIDYAGDLDVFRFVLASPAWVSTWTEGQNLDTVGTLLDSSGQKIDVNDDAEAGNNHFGITRELGAGTYFVQVAHWEPQGTGAYNFRMRADALDANETDLWWNPAESGWGININHQDHTIFATLFTYDEKGAPMWLVMSNGDRQADGSYSGALYRTTGSPFNAPAPGPASATQVGTMRIAFTGPSTATLTYGYNGTSVTKSITRQAFSTPTTCGWSAFDRSFSSNFQDLWWNPAQPGWGVNIAHQGSILFATLFTYDASGKGMWLVMPDGAGNGAASYSGTLYRTSGPAFNASPWTSITNVPVGTMTFQFTDGNTGTLTYTVDGVSVTKSILRQVFGALRAQCEP